MALDKLGPFVNPKTNLRLIMDSGRDKKTGIIICAIDLWLLHTVDEYGYECPSCGVTLEPASYRREVNKKRPYFRLYRDTNHHPNCGIRKEIKLKAEARKRPIRNSEGFPLPYPSKLLLKDEQSLITEGDCTSGILAAQDGSNLPGESTRNGKSRRHEHTTGTIRPLARTYLDFPYDRYYLSLSVDGVEGANYEHVFQHLFYADEVYFRKPKIFYAPVSYKKTIVRGDEMDVTLSQGRWNTIEGKSVLSEPYILRIHMRGWAKKMKSCVVDEIDITREEVRLEHRKGNKKIQAWLFFLGEQEASNRFLFHVRDPRLICCLPDVMVKKSLFRAAPRWSNTHSSTSFENLNIDPQKIAASKLELLQNPTSMVNQVVPNTLYQDVHRITRPEIKEPMVSRSPEVRAPAPIIVPERIPKKVGTVKNRTTVNDHQPVTGLKKIAHWLQRFLRQR